MNMSQTPFAPIQLISRESSTASLDNTTIVRAVQYQIGSLF
ncbi:hypothetical protein BofuT4_uP127640.1 [Botrytis cinerea T4]|uniref:Uncharacterized protein n=1 Tax=Botryotinia fuckeliana (strain T4) TaxID=999810 RepID=G2YSW8_BOTF4|nr:hypothetical protein BofuT4_uP127640.1 [Botrytis cinerea T4]